jgi:hypothetical protein
MEGILEFIKIEKVKQMEEVWICVTNAFKLLLVCVCDSDCIRCDAVTVVEARNLIADVQIWIVGSSVGDENNVDAVRGNRYTTNFGKHEVADAQRGSGCVGPASPRTTVPVVDAADGVPGVYSSSARVVEAIEAELDKVLVVERHHCDFDRVAEKKNQFAEDGGRSIEFAFSDAPRRVQNEENVLGAIWSATRLAPVAVSMLRHVELRWLEGEWLGFGC